MEDKLPVRMHKKGPSYYYVRHNVWTKLGRSIETALAAYEEMEAGNPGSETIPLFSKKAARRRRGLLRHCQKLYWQTKRNAKNRGLEFEITVADIEDLMRLGKYRCSVSGIVFSLSRSMSGVRRAYAPSIDRVDSSRGYHIDNIRLVLCAVNTALMDWGLDTYLHIADRTVQRAKRIKGEDGHKQTVESMAKRVAANSR